MDIIKENENKLPHEVFGAISQLMQFLEKVEDKYIGSNPSSSEEDKNENS